MKMNTEFTQHAREEFEYWMEHGIEIIQKIKKTFKRHQENTISGN